MIRIRRYAEPVKTIRRNGNWTPDGKAERAALRQAYRETTPEQRLEQAVGLSKFITHLAETGRRRRLG